MLKLGLYSTIVGISLLVASCTDDGTPVAGDDEPSGPATPLLITGEVTIAGPVSIESSTPLKTADTDSEQFVRGVHLVNTSTTLLAHGPVIVTDIMPLYDPFLDEITFRAEFAIAPENPGCGGPDRQVVAMVMFGPNRYVGVNGARIAVRATEVLCVDLPSGSTTGEITWSGFKPYPS